MLIVLEIAKMNILYSYLVQGFKVYAPVLQCRGYMALEYINRHNLNKVRHIQFRGNNHRDSNGTQGLSR
jgi:hypothetical protein